jgi:hypothetical protein
MSNKAAFRIKEVNRFWRYHIYKKTFFGWKKIAGADDFERAEEKLRESAEVVGGLLYDAEGSRI